MGSFRALESRLYRTLRLLDPEAAFGDSTTQPFHGIMVQLALAEIGKTYAKSER